MKPQQIADLINYAINNWDINIVTKRFAKELAQEIKNLEG